MNVHVKFIKKATLIFPPQERYRKPRYDMNRENNARRRENAHA